MKHIKLHYDEKTFNSIKRAKDKTGKMSWEAFIKYAVEMLK